MSTSEGSSAFQEFIDYLNAATPTHALQWSDDLSDAAEFLANKPLGKQLAKRKIEAELKAAQKDLGESQAKDADADKKEENDE